MAQIAYNPKFQAVDDTGAPLAGGKLYTYEAGTSTPKTTWSDSGEVTPQANPIILDSRGEATIYGSGTYKFILKTSADVTVWTVDNIAITGTVTTSDIQDGAVTTAKLASNVLSADATGRGKMQDGFVTSAKLDTGGVALPNGSTATTQSTGDNDTSVATTAFVQQEIDANEVIVGRAYTSNATYSRITTAGFLDDTVPLSTEGDSVMTITRSALSATNRYRYTVTIGGTIWPTSAAIASVWQGSTCIYATVISGLNGYEDRSTKSFSFENVPGTTSSTAFVVRVGVASPGYFDLNGYNGARTFGGVNACTFTIEEIKA